MVLNTRSVFDPRFAGAVGRVGQAAMTSSVLVRRLIGGDAGDNLIWSYEQGKWLGSAYRTIWSGDARYQTARPNRARSYDFANTTTAMQMVTFTLPVFDGVWNGALPESDRHFRDEDEVIVVANYFPHLDRNLPFVYKVRNPLVSGQASLQTLITDVDLKGRMPQ